MRIYFVRHGQTISNKTEVHQDAHDPLSDLGKRQGEYVAKKLNQFPLEIMYTSPFSRALDTAQIIHAQLTIPMEVTPLLREVHWPSVLFGKSHHSPESQSIRSMFHQNSHDPHYRHSDEETYTEIITRAKEFILLAEASGKKEVLAVTHGTFLKYLMAMLLFQDKLTPSLIPNVRNFFKMRNTGISIIEKRGESWHLITWNDYAHLNEITEE